MAAERLGKQWPRHGRMVQRRRVELHELHVGHGDARPQCHGDPVAGGLAWVGRDGEELAGTTGGQHDVVGPDLDHGAPRGQGRDPDAAPTLNQEIEGEPPLEHGAGRSVGGVDQRPLHLGAGGGAAGVHDAGAGVAALAGQRQVPAGLAVELGTERDELDARRTGPRRPGRARPPRHTGRLRRPACRQGADRWSPRRRRARRRRRPAPNGWPTATAHPWSGRRARAPPRAPSASRTAADRPATPLPRTRTSNGPGRAPALTPVRSGRARHRGGRTFRR